MTRPRQSDFPLDEIIAELVGFRIGGWDEIEQQMTLPRYQALRRHWRIFPPLEVLLSRPATPAPPVQDMTALAAFLGGPGPIKG